MNLDHLPFDLGQIWPLLLALREDDREPDSRAVITLGLDHGRKLAVNQPHHAWIEWDQCAGTWHALVPLAADARQALDLYLPLLARPDCVIAQLGQSLDGRIATLSGDSFFVTGPANLDHLHRLRALVDAVIVGTETARCDNPQLTTRRVPGPNPVRVVLDPERRLDDSLKLFTDAKAPTLLICRDDCAPGAGPGQSEPVQVAAPAGSALAVGDILGALRARGLRRVLVEGGGVTVSRFLAAGALDFLHLAIAPVIIGSGRQGLSLPTIERLSDALRPRTRSFTMGDDVIFALDFTARLAEAEK